MSATTIRVREPRELLALLPYQLGFHPRRSVVAVALRPPRGRVGMIARVDIADLADDDAGPQLARRLVTHLVGDGAARAVLVLYTDHDPRHDPSHGPREGPHAGAPGQRSAARAAVGHFRTAATGFLGDVAVWAVTPGGYLALDCRDHGCCPPGGRPLADLQSTEVGAHMVLAGAMVADSRETLVPDASAPGPARRNACRAAGRWHARRTAAEAAGPRALAAWRSHAVGTWRDQVSCVQRGEGRPGPAVLGRLIASLRDAVVRDAVLLTLVPGTGDLAERSLTATPGPGAPTDQVAAALGAIVSPRHGVTPDVEAHADASAVLHLVVAHAAGPDRAPGLTLLALLAWWHGDGARAGVLLERALRADPAYRLARLLTDALTAGLAPGWVRRSVT